MNAPAINDKIEQLESALLPLPQVDMPLTHRFTPGVYLREIFMPAGTLVGGHKHKTEHFNIVLCGSASVMIDGVVQRITGPCVFASLPGVRKVLYIHDDMRWATVHVTAETDVEKLEELLIEKSGSFLEYHEQEEARQLVNAVEGKETLCHVQQSV